MDFGKLPNVDNINFSLPPDHIDNASLFAKISQKDQPKVHIGCPAWGDRAFLGKIYPEKTKSSDFIHYYSKSFSTIEFNSTYYALPKAETIHKWKQKICDDFTLCPKIPSTISHSKMLQDVETEQQEFFDNFRLWEKHMGVAFLVLPLHFSTSMAKVLADYIEKYGNKIPLAVEFRDKSWFQQETTARKMFHFLEKHNVSTVISDVSGRRDVLHQRVTTNKVLIRFVGNNLHKTDYTRLKDWAIRLNEWMKEGVNEIYFFIHEPNAENIIDATNYFIGELRLLRDIQIRAPQIIELPEQQTFFDL